MLNEIYHVIMKWEGSPKQGKPILFLPTLPANPGNIMSYAHIGQHGEACLYYYRTCRNIPKTPEAQEQAKALWREYKRLVRDRGTLQLVHRDRPSFKKERYSHV
jgi:hypothetical protein